MRRIVLSFGLLLAVTAVPVAGSQLLAVGTGGSTPLAATPGEFALGVLLADPFAGTDLHFVPATRASDASTELPAGGLQSKIPFSAAY